VVFFQSTWRPVANSRRKSLKAQLSLFQLQIGSLPNLRNVQQQSLTSPRLSGCYVTQHPVPEGGNRRGNVSTELSRLLNLTLKETVVAVTFPDYKQMSEPGQVIWLVPDAFSQIIPNRHLLQERTG
jgi:hypothetical protein